MVKKNQQPGPEAEPYPQPKEELSAEMKKKLLEAYCAEKEGRFENAQKLFIELNMKDDAVRCSEHLNQKSRRQHNNRNIIVLTVFSVLLFLAFLIALITLNERQRNLVYPSVKWSNPANVELASYPPWFLYDKKDKQIKTRVVLDEKMSFELEKIYPLSADSTHFSEFRQAISKLAFISTDMKGSYYWLLLLVSGLASVVGVLIREILDLIRHYCYEKDLDFKTWWPWYLLRPLVGFMIGVMLILFSGTDLLINSAGDSSETYLIAIAIIAGISVEDVMFRIRKVSQVLFGNSSQDSDSDAKSGIAEQNRNNSVTPAPTPEKKNPTTEPENTVG